MSGTNNIDDTNPQFTAFNQNVSLNSVSNDFEIQSGSPAEDAGTDGMGHGGDGLANSITGSSVTYGGGGSGCAATAGTVIPGGAGGGGDGAKYNNVSAPGDGEDGKGGGGGGNSGNSGVYSTGGDGVIILRVATSDVGTPSGEDSSAVDGSDTVITWLATGSYTG